MRIKRNDYVVVTSGNHKGEKGRVKKIVAGTEYRPERVIVAGINVRKKHVKPSQENPKGGTIDLEMSLAISAVMPYSEKADAPSRIRIVKTEDGKKKVRILVKCGSEYGEKY